MISTKGTSHKIVEALLGKKPMLPENSFIDFPSDLPLQPQPAFSTVQENQLFAGFGAAPLSVTHHTTAMKEPDPLRKIVTRAELNSEIVKVRAEFNANGQGKGHTFPDLLLLLMKDPKPGAVLFIVGVSCLLGAFGGFFKH